ncbi:hypothetical protein DB346_15125 [Verrucomicrobia bacterium LW23]|nr:hypothetical protein DB346_15125 [Verrucomicrobia bacterium LW23]
MSTAVAPTAKTGAAPLPGTLTPAQARTYMARQDALLARMHDFHAAPTDYADPSQIAALLPVAPAVAGVIAATPRGRKALSVWILRKLQLADRPWASFEVSTSRLALLPAPVLRRAALLAGACVCSKEIARIISRDELNELKAAIGDETRTFALKTAPIMLGAPPPVEGVQPAKPGTAALVLATARRMLELAFSGESPIVLQRLRLKFPVGETPDFAPVALAEKARAAAYLTRIVTRHLAPDWAPCFA